MQRCHFHYDLPPGLIAQAPLPVRSDSRLLQLDGLLGRMVDGRFADLPKLLKRGDLLVFNDTRVVPARLFAHKESGGAVELLLERVLEKDDEQANIGLFLARSSKPLRQGMILQLQGGGRATVRSRQDDLVEIAFEESVLPYLQSHGQVPLPPYIDRSLESSDLARYQTVFARVDGAVAAPTAGLHFSREMLDALAQAGIENTSVTLHVGAGTFQPVRVDDLAKHRMHSERVEVSEAACEAVVAARARGARIVAVGTTVIRSLESASRDGALKPLYGETDLFIRPGYRFNIADALLTNFHLPESTLLMLVCAFAGYDHVMAAYRHAVEQRYRFFSYGDAMFVTRQNP